MTTSVFCPLPLESFFTPFQTISTLAAEKAGKFADIQLSALETYVAVGINQCRAATAAHSPEDLQTLAGKQAELMKLLGEKALVDLRQLMLLGTEFGTQVQEAMLESNKTVAGEGA